MQGRTAFAHSLGRSQNAPTQNQIIMNSKQTDIKYLKDYTPSAFLIDETYLEFDINDEFTVVKSELKIRRNHDSSQKSAPLVLDGENISLRSIALNTKTLDKNAIKITETSLTIFDVPESFILQLEVIIEPQNNTALYGMYKSKDNYCTQCEPFGFRHITYFIDRPDVLSKISTKIIADKTRYSTLLSNGDLVDSGELANNKHWVLWQDRSLKSIYLFALIAGHYSCLTDEFITRSGRKIDLKIYADHEYIHQCTHAMDSLKKAMKWDEDFYGREYDLDTYMIVSISDFNMGAMENKGLNIFNSKYVLASQDTATDFDFIHIASVIAHEYFHNWRGNRITIREWFQLSLKEGFTVFCDQEFTANLYEKSVKRIEDVTLIKTAQFTEDQGPFSHPVRPNSYVEVNNFYTLTVYDKGAEIVRMLQTFVGADSFRKAAALFFQLYDGMAVTIEDFLGCIEKISKVDLAQFKKWYDYAGTPIVDVSSEYSAIDKVFKLTVKQLLPKNPGVSLHFPLSIALFVPDESEELQKTRAEVLHITKPLETFSFANVAKKPIPSLLRNFSAPVKLHYPYTSDELCYLILHDTDDYNRWNAGQEFMAKVLLEAIEKYRIGDQLYVNKELQSVFLNILQREDLDFGLTAELLSLPSEAYLFELQSTIEIDGTHFVSEFFKKELAMVSRDILFDRYLACKNVEYKVDAESIGKRKFKNLALNYLMYLDDEEILNHCLDQYYNSNNMTDTFSSFIALVNSSYHGKDKIFNDFYTKWRNDPLVIDKWFTAHATTKQSDTLNKVIKLTEHEDFFINNPNRARALLGSFTKFNHVNFHQIDGRGYEFLKAMIMKIDPLNPQLSAYLVKSLIDWRRFYEGRKQLMKEQLCVIANENSISKNLREIVEKAISM